MMGKNINFKRNVRNVLIRQSVLILFSIFIIVMAFVRPSFTQINTINNVLIDASIYGVSALAITIVLVAGQWDISITSTFLWGTLFLCDLLNKWGGSTMGIIGAFLAVFASCCLFGLINGIIVVYGKIIPFIATMGTMNVIKGIALVYSNEKMITTKNAFVTDVGKTKVFNLSVLVYIFLALAVVAWFVMKYTRFGRSLYATGGNPAAAAAAGINVRFNQVFVYVMLGFATAISACMFVCRMRSGSVTYCTDFSLTCASAAIIGGTSMRGGVGNPLKTVLGVIVIFGLYKALGFLGIQGYYSNLIKGIVIMSIILMDGYLTRSGKMKG